MRKFSPSAQSVVARGKMVHHFGVGGKGGQLDSPKMSVIHPLWPLGKRKILEINHIVKIEQAKGQWPGLDQIFREKPLKTDGLGVPIEKK